MDNVTSPENTPEGYEYIGKSDYDILKDMGIQTNYETQKVSTFTASLDGGEGGIAILWTKTISEGNITVLPLVSCDFNSKDKNNVMGKKFEGIVVTAYLTQYSYSGNQDLLMEYGGKMDIEIGDQKSSFMLKEPNPKGSYIKAPNSKTLQSRVSITEKGLNSSSNIYVSIKAGTTTQGIFHHKKLLIDMNWKIK